MWKLILSMLNVFNNMGIIWDFLQQKWNWQPLPSGIVAIILSVIIFLIPIAVIIAVVGMIRRLILNIFK